MELEGFQGIEGLVRIGETSLSFVGNLGQVATVAVNAVGDLLQASIGQCHTVNTLGVIKLAGLLVAEIVAGVTHGIPEAVVWPSGGGGGDHGQEGQQLYEKGMLHYTIRGESTPMPRVVTRKVWPRTVHTDIWNDNVTREQITFSNIV